MASPGGRKKVILTKNHTTDGTKVCAKGDIVLRVGIPWGRPYLPESDVKYVATTAERGCGPLWWSSIEGILEMVGRVSCRTHPKCGEAGTFLYSC